MPITCGHCFNMPRRLATWVGRARRWPRRVRPWCRNRAIPKPLSPGGHRGPGRTLRPGAAAPAADRRHAANAARRGDAGGAVAYAQGRPQRAVRAWTRLVTMQPMNVVARQLLAAAQIGAGDRPAALATLRPILARTDAAGYAIRLGIVADPDAAAALSDRAALARRGDAAIFRSDRAVIDLKIGAKDTPTDPTYALGLIRGWRARATAPVRSGSPSRWSQRALAPGRAAGLRRYTRHCGAKCRGLEALCQGGGPDLRRADHVATGRQLSADGACAGRGGQPGAVSFPEPAKRARPSPARSVADGRRSMGRRHRNAGGLRAQLGLRDIALLHDLAVAYVGAGTAWWRGAMRRRPIDWRR